MASLALVALQGVDVVVALAAESSIGVPAIFFSANRAFAVVELGDVVVTEVAAIPLRAFCAMLDIAAWCTLSVDQLVSHLAL